jgi:D-3-phosphoglycerate dehydrogenase
VDVNYCAEKNIIITNVPAGNATAAAELAVGLMLDALRGISRADALMKSGEWDRGRQIGHELGSQKIGIIGLGNIGRRVANLAKAFGAEVSFYDAFNTEDSTYTYRKLDDLLSWATIATIHVTIIN